MAVYSILEYVAPLQIDVPNPKLRFTITSHAGSSLSLAIKMGTTTVLTITGVEYTGQGSVSIPLTQSQRHTILAAMPNDAFVNATYVLTTNPNLGSSSYTARISTSPEYSSPSFSSLILQERNFEVIELLQGEGYIQELSELWVWIDNYTIKNSATLARCELTIGTKTEGASTNTFTFGSIPVSGEVVATATLYDSRGYSYSKTETITVYPYRQISVNSYSIKRENNVDNTIQLSFAGSFSPVEVNGTALNTFQGAVYRYKLTTASTYSADEAITGITSDDNSFSYDNNAWITLSNDYAYDVQIEVSDTLGSTTLTLQVSQGKPTMCIRKLGVGFGKSDVECEVDVAGDIHQNGFNVMGTRLGEIADTVDLNDIKTQGLYMRFQTGSTTANHYPASSVRGVLEVFEAVGVSTVLQRFTDMDNAKIYTRVYGGSSWTTWTQI